MDSVIQLILIIMSQFVFYTMGAQPESDVELEVVDTIDDVNRDEWNDVVERATERTVFHRTEWLGAVESGLGYRVRHALLQKDSNLIGVFPNVVLPYEKTPFRRLVSLQPGFGGPVLTTDRCEALALLAARMPEQTAHQTLTHQIRAAQTSYLGYNNILKTHGYRPTRDGCRFQLGLENGYDDVWNRMRSGRRRRIRRGRENEYELIEEELTDSNLQQFHETYAQVMNRVGGETLPLTFLEQFRQLNSRVLLLTLRVDGEYAGGSIELLDENNNTIHGFLSAVPEGAFEYNASELLYDGVIQWGIEHSYETYDLGYTPSDATDGLFKFKRSFGGEMVPNLSWERGCSPVWPLVRAGRSLYWSRYKSTGKVPSG